jgi:hypothetical protein
MQADTSFDRARVLANHARGAGDPRRTARRHSRRPGVDTGNYRPL